MGSVLGIAHINKTNRRELFRSSIKTKYCLRAGKKALRSRKRSPLCATFATEADCIGRFPAGLSTCWLLGLLLVVLPGTLPQTHLLFCWVSEGPAAEWMSITIQTHIKYRVLLPVSCLSQLSHAADCGGREELLRPPARPGAAIVAPSARWKQ